MSFGAHAYALLWGYNIGVLPCESVDLVVSVQHCFFNNILYIVGTTRVGFD